MSLGGNVMTLGTKPDGSSWTVAITDPFSPESLIGSVTVTGQAVVTSGNYEKYFEENGKRYHHILDPCTGAPSESDVVSTTIIADKALTVMHFPLPHFSWGRCRHAAHRFAGRH